jgi:hypothetical protein
MRLGARTNKTVLQSIGAGSTFNHRPHPNLPPWPGEGANLR